MKKGAQVNVKTNYYKTPTMLSPTSGRRRPSDTSDRSGLSKLGGNPNQRGGGPIKNTSYNKVPALTAPIRSQENSQTPASASNSPRGSLTSANTANLTPQGSSSRLQTLADDTIVIRWEEKNLDKVPELSLLTKRSAGFHVISGDCVSKFLSLLTSICKAFNKVDDSSFANFKPVESRTEHTLEYVGDLAREYTINLKYGAPKQTVLLRTPSGTTINSNQSKASKGSNTSTKKKKERAEQVVKSQLLKDYYDKSYRTLSILQQCTGYFRTIIFNLTFSRYSEEELTESEAKMIRGKSIVGSCIWVVTLALQQLQEDPEVEFSENFTKGNSELVEVGVELAALVGSSLHIWHDILVAIKMLEKMHKRTEDVFQKQTDLLYNIHAKVNPNAEAVHLLDAHIKEYRRPPFYEIEELKNFKFDPYASLLAWHSNKRHGESFARILYLPDYVDPDNLWLGFDTLRVDKKVTYIKDILNFIRLVLESVKENIQKLNADLSASTNGPDTLSPAPPRAQRTYNYTGINTYEEGMDAIDEVFTKKLVTLIWNTSETREVFETDKIFLDDMDVIALAAAIAKSIIFEARHALHVCYETCRVLSYKEFATLPSYEKIYQKVKESYGEEILSHTPDRTGFKKGRPASFTTGMFDMEESHLQLRNVAGLFRTSPYRDITKNLPIYTNRIGVTLQDAEMVFTPSSEKLLS